MQCHTKMGRTPADATASMLFANNCSNILQMTRDYASMYMVNFCIVCK